MSERMMRSRASGRVCALARAGIVGATLLFGASVATAAPLLVDGSAGSLAAEAYFATDGTNLVVTLKNTSLNDVIDPSQILTGVFFNINSASAISMTPTSAVLAPGSTVVFGVTESGNSVGGEWAYKSSLSGGPGGRAYGISSAGLGLFGPPNLFPGANLQGPDNPDGLQYGITSAGDNVSLGNAAVTGSNALIQSGVVFRLSGLPGGFSPSTQIADVWFQYGTNLSEGGFVPEPASLMLVAVGTALLVRRRRR